jgi:hypothetical protein
VQTLQGILRRCTALWSRSVSSLGAVVATTMVLETPTCAAYHTNTTAETACHAPLTTVASAHSWHSGHWRQGLDVRPEKGHEVFLTKTDRGLVVSKSR